MEDPLFIEIHLWNKIRKMYELHSLEEFPVGSCQSFFGGIQVDFIISGAGGKIILQCDSPSQALAFQHVTEASLRLAKALCSAPLDKPPASQDNKDENS